MFWHTSRRRLFGVGTLTAALLCLAAGPQSARAESDSVCKRYADDAVRAQKFNNERPGCKRTGDMWSSNWSGHYNWCKGKDARTVTDEHNKRMGELTRCTGDGQRQAEQQKFCDGYANDAVHAQRQNGNRESCRLTGDMWSVNWGGHKNWCMGQPRHVVEAEAKRRMDTLASCSARPAFCQGYANRAISAQNVNTSTPNCGKQGPRWSTNYDSHYRWCLTQDRRAAEAEEKTREDEVRECSVKAAPKPPGTFSGNRINGIELFAETGGRPTRIAGDGTFLSQQSLCGMLVDPRVRALINERIKAMIRQEAGGHMPKGFGIRSDARNELGGNCAAYAEVASAAGGAVRINIKLPGNRFFFHVTTPKGIPGALDPEFSVGYDLEVNIFVAVPTSVYGSLGVKEVLVAVTNVSRLRGENTGGDVGVAADAVVRYFGGPDITRKIRENRLIPIEGLTANLDRISTRLRVQRYMGGVRIEHRLGGGGVLQLIVTRRPESAGPVIR